jgi:hypothetical protein
MFAVYYVVFTAMHWKTIHSLERYSICATMPVDYVYNLIFLFAFKEIAITQSVCSSLQKGREKSF